jgi:hypothetical protein
MILALLQVTESQVLADAIPPGLQRIGMLEPL